MDKKEIVIVTKSMSNNGAERVLSELTREWLKEGIEISIVQIDPEPGHSSFLNDSQVEIFDIRSNLKMKPLRLVAQAVKLAKILKKKKHASVLSFLSVSSFVVAAASLMVPNKIVLAERNDPRRVPPDKLQKGMRDWAFRKADRCVFQTEEARDYFPQKVRNKGTIICNPVNPLLPKPNTAQREKTIITACRLQPQKNLPMLIDAFMILHQEHPEYTLIIFGRGPLEETLKELVRSKGMEQSILFPGFSDNVYDEMSKCGIFVMSSDYEGISNSMIEALGMGAPTVVTDCPVGGARLVIRHKENGLLVPVGDSQAMYLAMKRVIEDRDLANTLSKNAVSVRDTLAIDQISKEWLDVIL